MSTTVLYEGYALQSTPHYYSEWEKWQLCVVISIRSHGGVKPRQFSSEVLYATEQEADSHGIDLGQRIIDGKVEGLSVVYMKMGNRRAKPRFQGHFQTTVSDCHEDRRHRRHAGSLGRGMPDSKSATRFERCVSEGCISVPGFESPIQIDGARVQWVSGSNLGLAFVQINRTEQQRLDRLIADLRIRGTDEGPRTSNLSLVHYS